LLYNLIVKHDVICHKKPELQAYVLKLAPMQFIDQPDMWQTLHRGNMCNVDVLKVLLISVRKFQDLSGL